MTDNRALWELVEKYDEHMQAIGGCSDGGCAIVKPKGMHTNGGCRCLRDHLKAQRLAHAAMNLRKGLAAILERPVVVGDEDVERAASAYDKVINSRVLHWTSGNPFAKNDAMLAALESMVRGKS